MPGGTQAARGDGDGDGGPLQKPPFQLSIFTSLALPSPHPHALEIEGCHSDLAKPARRERFSFLSLSFFFLDPMSGGPL